MFRWFSPRCPLNTWEKTWTEHTMRWFAERFGAERLLEAEVLVPDDLYISDANKGTRKYARRMMELLCDYMDVDPNKIKLEVLPDVNLPGGAGHYDKQKKHDPAVIRVARSQLDDPQMLAATLAHELAHELLIGVKIDTQDEVRDEWVTDLLPVFLGVGIFAANRTVQDQHVDMWSVIRRHGYLTARIFGYGMALFCFVRDEREPTWLRELRPDAATAMRRGIRFLFASGDSLCHPATIELARGRPTSRHVVNQLQTGTPSIRLAALWEIQEFELTDAACLESVIKCLDDHDEYIVAEAAAALVQFKEAAAPAIPKLHRFLWNPIDEIRGAAVRALGELQLQPDTIFPDLCAMLDDRSPTVFNECALALANFGRHIDKFSLKRLLTRLETALTNLNDYDIAVIAHTLLAVTDDPECCVADYFSHQDGELRGLALEALQAQRAHRR